MTTKETAIKLREDGYSYRYISKQTGLSVSTLSYHLSKIPFAPNKTTVETIGNARVAAARSKASAKQKSINEAREYVRGDIGVITSRDLLMLGIGLYIGEGSKTNDIVRLVNTDYRVVNLYIACLEKLGVTREHLTLRIHLYPDSNIKQAEQFWIKKTGIKKSQLQKECIDRRVGKDRKRSGTHLYGTAHVTVRSMGVKTLGVVLARRISAYMEEMLEYRR